MHNTREVAFDSVRDSQRVFRLVLDAMARPGKVVALPDVPLTMPRPWHAGVGLVALTLLDQEVTFAAVGDGSAELTAYVAQNTRAKTAPPQQAEFVFAHGTQPDLADLIQGLDLGTLEQPDHSATLLLTVDELADTAAPAGGRTALCLTLSGPGIAGERQLWVRGLAPAALAGRAEVNSAYPMGFDLILFDPAGRLASLPRTTRCDVEVPE